MTCAIAGIDENRKVICIEKDKEIFEMGKNRVIEYQKEKGKDVCIKYGIILLQDVVMIL